MFSHVQINELVRRRPFVPIRIVTSTGETFDVYHPDLIMVGQRQLIIGRAVPNEPTTFDLASHVSILHVSAIHDLPSAVPASGGAS
jgi:hypothetical protein